MTRWGIERAYPLTAFDFNLSDPNRLTNFGNFFLYIREKADDQEGANTYEDGPSQSAQYLIHKRPSFHRE